MVTPLVVVRNLLVSAEAGLGNFKVPPETTYANRRLITEAHHDLVVAMDVLDSLIAGGERIHRIGRHEV